MFSYINFGGTFYYLTSLLDGCSRYIVHWELRESMTERDIETIVQRGLERFPAERPRIISDNGPQFIARDFQQFIRLVGLTHVRISPYYPQSNGKLERWHKSLKHECVRPAAPATLDQARQKIAAFVEHYNHVRLHSALRYITPVDRLNDLGPVIFAERDRKLEQARERRRLARQAAREICLMPALALRSTSARAEDTALLRSNRSTVPGARTEVRAVRLPAAARPSLLRDWHSRAKPSRYEAAISSTGCPSPLANVHPAKFQFTGNQDTHSARWPWLEFWQEPGSSTFLDVGDFFSALLRFPIELFKMSRNDSRPCVACAACVRWLWRANTCGATGSWALPEPSLELAGLERS